MLAGSGVEEARVEFRYVEWIDGAWLASDARGCLAAMVTAGPGPIAAWTLGDGYDDFDIEERLLALPINGQAQSVAPELDYPSFFALAERGLFVYDWQDAHRIRVEHRKVYEAVAIPSVPLTLADLPEDLRRIAERAFFDLEFRQARDVPMMKLVDRGGASAERQ